MQFSITPKSDLWFVFFRGVAGDETKNCLNRQGGNILLPQEHFVSIFCPFPFMHSKPAVLECNPSIELMQCQGVGLHFFCIELIQSSHSKWRHIILQSIAAVFLTCSFASIDGWLTGDLLLKDKTQKWVPQSFRGAWAKVEIAGRISILGACKMQCSNASAIDCSNRMPLLDAV